MSDTSIEILLATTENLKDIQFCARAAYAKYVTAIGQEPAPMNADFAVQISMEHMYIAVFQSAFAGYVVFYPEDETLHLENVAVLPSFRGRGIGKKLIAFVEEKAKQSGKQSVELYTNEVMSENLAMYPRLGYAEIERKRQMGFNRVFFRKLI